MGEVIAFPGRRTAPLPARPLHSAGQSPEPPAAQHLAELRTVATGIPVGRPTPNPPREPLWREVTGSVLREERHRQQRTLGDVAGRAGMSVQYLSELERGRKEASSEMLAAACGALGLGLAEFARRCAGTISTATARPTGPLLMAA